MKNYLSHYSFRAALATGLLFISLAFTARAADASGKAPAPAAAGILVPVDAKTDASWLATARAEYPLTRCPVCDDKLSTESGGKSVDYVYKRTGQPDRLVRFCGDDECVPNFKKDPDRYIKVIDAADVTKAAPPKR